VFHRKCDAKKPCSVCVSRNRTCMPYNPHLLTTKSNSSKSHENTTVDSNAVVSLNASVATTTSRVKEVPVNPWNNNFLFNTPHTLVLFDTNARVVGGNIPALLLDNSSDKRSLTMSDVFVTKSMKRSFHELVKLYFTFGIKFLRGHTLLEQNGKKQIAKSTIFIHSNYATLLLEPDDYYSDDYQIDNFRLPPTIYTSNINVMTQLLDSPNPVVYQRFQKFLKDICSRYTFIPESDFSIQETVDIYDVTGGGPDHNLNNTSSNMIVQQQSMDIDQIMRESSVVPKFKPIELSHEELVQVAIRSQFSVYNYQ
jgi:hypothetical protein